MDINSIIDGKYKVISLVGKGGTATVYKAININLGNEWAIKEISKSNKEKFDLLVEPNLLKKLQHPSLPRIVDIIESKDVFYIIEDFIDGTSLDTLLVQVDKFPEDKVIEWGLGLAEVLSYLHKQEPNPIIYRDMKPGNIMLSNDGKIKLIDFGIAREYKKEVTSDTVIIGTRGYAAPEQYGKHQTDERSDIYSLGVTLYHLVTGKGPNDPPFEIVPIRSLDSDLSEGLEHIILKCTYQDPAKRYQNVEELIYDFNNIDKLSNKYKKEQRTKKLKIAAICCVFLFFNSLILTGAFSIRGESISKYQDRVEIASQTAKTLGIEKAIPDFKAAIEMEKKRPEAYLGFAKVYIDNMQFDEALVILQRDAVLNYKSIKNNEEYCYLLGQCLFYKGDYLGAKQQFELVDSKENYSGINFYLQFSDYLSKPEGVSENDEITKALDDCKQEIEQSTDTNFKIRGYVTLADLYRDNQLVFKDAGTKQIELLQKAISIDRDNVVVYERLANAYYSQGIQLLADDEVASKEAFNKSLENYRIIIGLGYESETAYRNMAKTYRQLEDYGRSKEILETFISKYPDDFRGYVDMALICKIIEDKKDSASRSYTDFVKYYNLAKERNTDKDNVDMKTLEKQAEILRGKGAIS